MALYRLALVAVACSLLFGILGQSQYNLEHERDLFRASLPSTNAGPEIISGTRISGSFYYSVLGLARFLPGDSYFQTVYLALGFFLVGLWLLLQQRRDALLLLAALWLGPVLVQNQLTLWNSSFLPAFGIAILILWGKGRLRYQVAGFLLLYLAAQIHLSVWYLLLCYPVVAGFKVRPFVGGFFLVASLAAAFFLLGSARGLSHHFLGNLFVPIAGFFPMVSLRDWFFYLFPAGNLVLLFLLVQKQIAWAGVSALHRWYAFALLNLPLLYTVLLYLANSGSIRYRYLVVSYVLSLFLLAKRGVIPLRFGLGAAALIAQILYLVFVGAWGAVLLLCTLGPLVFLLGRRFKAPWALMLVVVLGMNFSFSWREVPKLAGRELPRVLEANDLTTIKTLLAYSGFEAERSAVQGFILDGFHLNSAILFSLVTPEAHRRWEKSRSADFSENQFFFRLEGKPCLESFRAALKNYPYFELAKERGDVNFGPCLAENGFGLVNILWRPGHPFFFGSYGWNFFPPEEAVKSEHLFFSETARKSITLARWSEGAEETWLALQGGGMDARSTLFGPRLHLVGLRFFDGCQFFTPEEGMAGSRNEYEGRAIWPSRHALDLTGARVAPLFFRWRKGACVAGGKPTLQWDKALLIENPSTVLQEEGAGSLAFP